MAQRKAEAEETVGSHEMRGRGSQHPFSPTLPAQELAESFTGPPLYLSLSHAHNTLLYNFPHPLTYIQIPASHTPSPPSLLKCPLLSESYPDHQGKVSPFHPLPCFSLAHLSPSHLRYVISLHLSFTCLLLTGLLPP